MYTSSFGGPKFDPNDHSKLAQPKPKNIVSSEIQICPAYLNAWIKDQIKTFADQGQKPAAGRSIKSIFKAVDKKLDKAIEKIWNLEGLTPMDVYKTSDVIMMHEMTHGIFGYGLDDVDGSKAYGWKNIRAISDRKSPDNTLKATNNADSLAYFCLGSKMISPGGSKEAQRANEDGTIAPLLPKGTKSKRGNLPRRSEQKQRRQERSPYQDQSPKDTPFTTLQRIVKRAQGPSSSQSQPGKSSSSHPPAGPSSSQHGGRVKYHTVQTVVTTIITEKLTVPYTTIDETGGGAPPPSTKSGKSSQTGKSSSEHHKSTSKSGASSSSGGGGGGGVKPSSKSHSDSKSKSQSQSQSQSQSRPQTPTSNPNGKTTSKPGGGQPTSKPGSGHSSSGGHGITSNNQQSTASNAPQTTVTVTNDGKTSAVVYIGLPLPTGKPGDPKDPLGWKCTGPLCDPKCLFPILCKSTPGSGVWGLITGWIPKLPSGKPPPPGGPSPPPKPPGNDDPPKSHPNESGPSKSDKPTESKESKASTTRHSSTTSCRPRTTSVCPVVATQIQGPDGKETTKRVTQSCKTTTLYDCTTQVHGSTSTAAITQNALTAIEFGDGFEMGISNWEGTRDAALAALVADTTDPYDYPDATGGQPSQSSGASATPTSSKPSTKPSTTQKPSTKPSSQPSSKPSSKPSSEPAKPSSQPSSKPSSKPTSTASGPKPSSTKYTDRCKDVSNPFICICTPLTTPVDV